MWSVEFNNNLKINFMQCNWLKLPNLPIKSVSLQVYHKNIILSGFEQYLYLQENYQIFNTKHETIIDTLNFLAKYNQQVFQCSINVRKGYIQQIKNIWGKEFRPLQWNPKLQKFEFGVGRKTNRNWWKIGIKEIPIIKIK